MFAKNARSATARCYAPNERHRHRDALRPRAIVSLTSTEVVSLSRTSERAYRRGIVASKRSGHTFDGVTKVCKACREEVGAQIVAATIKTVAPGTPDAARAHDDHAHARRRGEPVYRNLQRVSR